MSDNSNKHYSDYFKALEQHHLAENKHHVPKHTDNNKSAKTATSSKSNNKSFYKVIKVNPVYIILSVIIIISVIYGTIRITKSVVPNEKSKPIEKIKNNVRIDSTNQKTLSFDFPQNTQPIPTTNDSSAAIIINMKTNTVVSSRNPHQHMFPASTTKVMTLLTAVDYIENYNDTFRMTLAITDPLFKQQASVAGFSDGEDITMTDLLYGAILPSGADATMGLAIKIAGSEQKFAELMNKKAEELGLKDTHFVNTTGLFDENHYTSVYDMSIILATALDSPLCRKILSTYQYTTAKTPQHPDGLLLTSTLFSWMYGNEPKIATINGGKTGFVNESGYCIASFGTNNTTNNEYIIVTFKNSSRWPAILGQIELYKEFAK